MTIMHYRIEHYEVGEVDIEVKLDHDPVQEIIDFNCFYSNHQERVDAENGDKFIASLKYLALILLLEFDPGASICGDDAATYTPDFEACPSLDGSRGIKLIGLYRNSMPESSEFELIKIPQH